MSSHYHDMRDLDYAGQPGLHLLSQARERCDGLLERLDAIRTARQGLDGRTQSEYIQLGRARLSEAEHWLQQELLRWEKEKARIITARQRLGEPC